MARSRLNSLPCLMAAWVRGPTGDFRKLSVDFGLCRTSTCPLPLSAMSMPPSLSDPPGTRVTPHSAAGDSRTRPISWQAKSEKGPPGQEWFDRTAFLRTRRYLPSEYSDAFPFPPLALLAGPNVYFEPW